MPKKKNPVGRPPKYSNSEDLQKKVDEYFTTGRKTRQVIIGKKDDQTVIEIPIITICGLVRYCGFCNRASFYDYEKIPEFTDTIKNARTRIEEEYEELLQRGLGAGAIFALKNFDWKDEHTVKGEGFTPEIKIFVQNILQRAGVNDTERAVNQGNIQSQNQLN